MLVLVFGRGGVACCVGGVCSCVFVLFCFFLSFSLSFLLLSLSSLFFPSSLFCLLFLFLFSLLFSPPNTVERTDQPTRWPTSRHLKVIWRTAGAQQSVLSLLLSPPSSLLSLSSSKKEEGTFYYRNVSGEVFHYSFRLIPKNRRRVKLQALQFYNNSKTIGL